MQKTRKFFNGRTVTHLQGVPNLNSEKETRTSALWSSNLRCCQLRRKGAKPCGKGREKPLKKMRQFSPCLVPNLEKTSLF